MMYELIKKYQTHPCTDEIEYAKGIILDVLQVPRKYLYGAVSINPMLGYNSFLGIPLSLRVTLKKCVPNIKHRKGRQRYRKPKIYSLVTIDERYAEIT